jgi:mRNA-degrading endonuclease RelE of RelBE toxin-antitoxin system
LARAVAFRESAAAEFLLLPKTEQRLLKDALSKLAASLPEIPAGVDVEDVRGTKTLRRLAISEYRCVFRFTEDSLEVLGVGLRPGFYLRFE